MDTSSGTDDSDEEPPAHSMASSQGLTDPPTTSRANRSKGHEGKELRLSDLTAEEEKDQLFYFHYTSRSDNDFVVRCLCCGTKGHMHYDCPERECKHCGAYDKHPSSGCPQGRKCARCRQRGHDSRDCTNPTKAPNTIETACDICGKTGHVEEECMQMWCTGLEPMTMRPVRRMWKAW